MAPPDIHLLDADYHRSIPPRDYIEKLLSAFGQQWLNGAKSVVDLSSGIGVKFPLWVVGLWSEMHRVVEGRKRYSAILKFGQVFGGS